ncbi:MAG: flippase [Edaphobacter sp.]|uniref:flippase n=1 Tax=Edaphobacter sp. TaxID=1934404 RepID=UPI00239F8BE7|nr:flippase [Edaphobacter sp.]MDE1178833.1 flippase [Edaphobacter sp.]
MSLKRNTLYNLLGSILPMFIGMVTVPIYLRTIGDARYGVLALVWLFLGYFGLFDPGISRAATYHIARLHKPEQTKERESVFWTALLVNLGFGLVGGIAVYLAARPVFMTTFKMPENMRAEVMASLPWLASSVPISIVTGMIGGAVQARERFASYNIVGVVGAILSQIVPLAVAKFHGPNLEWLIAAVLITRIVSAAPYCFTLWTAMPLFKGGGYDRRLVKPLFSYGGWITVTNLLNPILTTADRMLVGSVLNAQAVAFYSVPFNLVSRASVIPGSLQTSLFPRLSQASTPEESGKLAYSAVAALAAVMTPICVIGIASMPIFMRLWVGSSFADHSWGVGVVLLIGIWLNALGYIPYGQLQAMEKPDVVAKFHAIELVPFLGVLWLGLHFFGLIGAAWAWTFRMAIDSALLFAVGSKINGWTRVLTGLGLVLLAAVFPPQKILSVRTLIELAIIAVSIVWSLRISPAVGKLLRLKFGSKGPSQEVVA